jgi:fibronectin-binding autotransporter adhesin
MRRITTLARVITAAAALIAACGGLPAGAADGVLSQVYLGTGDFDTSVGLSADKTYVSAVNIGGDALSINGVAFEGTGTTLNPSGTGFTTSGLSLRLFNDQSAVTGSLGTLLDSFAYAGNPQTVTLTNLSAGQTYTLTFYNRQWDASGPDRGQNTTTTSGATFSFFESPAGGVQNSLNLLRYTFSASGTSEAITFTAQTAGSTFHNSGFTTEQVFNNAWVSGSDWTTATWGLAAPNGVGTNADFEAQASPTTIALDAATTLGNLRVAGENAWTLSGASTLTLAADTGASAVLAATSGRHEIAVPMTWSSNIFKTGAGTLVLSGAITDNSRAITLGAGTLEFAVSGSQTIGGVISEGGTLAKSGAGTLTLSAANTFTGPTELSAGILELTNALALQSSRLDLAGGSVSLGAGVTAPTFGGLSGSTDLATAITAGYGSVTGLTLNPAAGVTATFSGAIADGAAGTTLSKTGAGTQVLSGTNTYTGGTTVSAGRLVAGSTAAFGAAAAPLTVAGGTLDLGGFAITRSGTVSIAGTVAGGTLEQNTLPFQATTGSVSATLAGSAGLVKTGPGTLTLNGLSTYTGPTTVSGGTLRLDAGGALVLADDFAAAGNPNTANINYNLAARQTGSAATQNWTGTGNVQVGNATNVGQPGGGQPGGTSNPNYMLLAAGGQAQLAGLPLSTANAAGPLKIGFDLYNGTNAATADWVSFTLRASADGNPVAGSGEFGMLYRGNTGIQVFNNGAPIQTLNSTTGGPSFALYLSDLSGTGSPFAGNGTQVVLTQGGQIVNTYTLNTGMGTRFTAFGSNETMVGGVDNFALNPFASPVAAASAVDLAAGTVLALDAVQQTVAGLTGDATSSVQIGPFARLTVAEAGTATYPGTISGAMGQFAMTGAGTLTLSGTNTYGGGTSVSGGRLVVGSAAALGSTTAPLGVTGGTLDLDGRSLAVGTLSGSVGGVIESGLAGAVTLTASSAASSTFAGDLRDGSGTLALVKSGSGTLTLSGANTFTGGSQINGGVLALGSPDALGPAGPISFGGGTLRFSAANTTDYSDRFSTAAGQAYALDTNGQNIAVGTPLTSEGGTLTKFGGGTVSLTAANTFSGTTTIAAGTLRIGAGGTTGGIAAASPITGSTGATLAFNRTDDYGGAFSNTIGGGIGVTLSSGTLALTAVNTYSGVTQITGGTLNVATLSDYGVDGSLGNRSQALDNTDGENIGLLFNTGRLQYTGSTPQSTDRYIRVGLGGAVLDASGSVPEATMSFTAASSPNFFQIRGSRVLTLTGTNPGANLFALQIPNQGTNQTGLTKSGDGTWLLSGASTYTGETVFQGGVLEVSGLTDYGVAGPLGARASSEDQTAAQGGSIGLRFQGGTLRYAGATAQSTNRAIRLSLAGGTLDASGSVPEATMSFTATSSPNLFETGGSRTLTLTGSNTGDNTFAMAIAEAGGATSLVKSGAGKWVLTGTNTYTGATTISAGTLQVGAGGTLGTIASASPIANSGTLVFDRSDSPAVSNTISGSGSVVHRGTGSLALSGANSFAGGTQVAASAGTLLINGVTALGSGTLTIDGGSLDTGGVVTSYGTVSLATNGANPQTWNADVTYRGTTRPANLGTGQVTLGGNRVVTVDNASSLAVGGLAGGFALEKAGDGTLVLQGPGSQAATAVAAGTLRAGAGGVLGTGGLTVAAGATFAMGSLAQSAGGLSGAGSVVGWTPGASTSLDGSALVNTAKNYVQLLDFGNGTAATVNGVAFTTAGTSGAGFALTGATTLFPESGTPAGYSQLMSDFYYDGNPGTLTFSDLTPGTAYEAVLYTQVGAWANRVQNATFTNGTSVETLSNLDAGAVGAVVYGFVAQGTTASIQMTPTVSTTTFHWFGASLEQVADQTLTVGDSGNHSFSGGISGRLALAKVGSGIQTLSGTSSFTGGSTVSAGTLVAAAAGALGTGPVTVEAGGMLRTNPGITLANALSLAGGAVGQISPEALATEAGIVAGTAASPVALAPVFAWSPRSGPALSDILGLTGTSGTVQILSLSYDAAALGGADPGTLFLGWLDDGSWVNATAGNLVGPGSSAVFDQSVGFSSLGITATAAYLGSWGRDPVNETVWAVVDHNSQFSVIAVPEPSALGMTLAGLAAVAAVACRRWGFSS